MIKYVSIKSALRFIPRSLFDQSTDSDFMSWMLDAYRQLDIPIALESKIKILELTNGTLEIPEDVKEINLITYLDKEPSDTDLYSLSSCICNAESNANTEDTNNPCQYTLAYRQFLDSPYYQNNYLPLLYKGNSSNLLCSNCANYNAKCHNVFTIDKNNILRTNIISGFLCIDYDTDMVDDNGDFLIVDITEIKQFLAYYAIAKHWEERASVKEESAFKFAQDALQKAEIWFKKARGILILRGINPQDIVSAQYDGYQKYLKIPERYVYAR